MLRLAAPFARVSQPEQGRLASGGHASARFVLKYDSSAGRGITRQPGAFNVTKTEGIVYVQDIALLRKSEPKVV